MPHFAIAHVWLMRVNTIPKGMKAKIHNMKKGFKRNITPLVILNIGILIYFYPLITNNTTPGGDGSRIFPYLQFVDSAESLYPVWNPYKSDRSAVQFVSRDGNESVVFAYRLFHSVRNADQENNRLVLHGLDPDALYTLSGDIHEQQASGRELMSSGINFYIHNNLEGRLIRVRQQN